MFENSTNSSPVSVQSPTIEFSYTSPYRREMRMRTRHFSLFVSSSVFFFLFCVSYEDTEIDTRFHPVAWFCITRRWKEVSWDDTGARKVMLSIDHRHAMLHYSFFFFLYMWHFTTNTRALTLRLRWMCKETTNQTRISSARILFIFAQYMSLLYRTTKDHLCDSIAWFRVVYILTHRLL